MFLCAVSLLVLTAWIGLGLTRLSVFERIPRLGFAAPPPSWPAVVAVIPARDEAATIGAVVGAHVACDYPGAFSAIIVDDGSSDHTAALARRAAPRRGARAPSRSSRLRRSRKAGQESSPGLRRKRMEPHSVALSPDRAPLRPDAVEDVSFAGGGVFLHADDRLLRDRRRARKGRPLERPHLSSVIIGLAKSRD